MRPFRLAANQNGRDGLASTSQDGQESAARPLLALRYPAKPSPAKPASISAQVDGSGAAAAADGIIMMASVFGVAMKPKVPEPLRE